MAAMPIELSRRRPVADLMPSKMARRIIVAFEGLQLRAYRDSVGILTAGYGHVGPEVTEGMQITLKQADDWLEEDIAEAWGIVRDAIKVPLTQGEADALTSIAFNLGKIPPSMRACLNGGTTSAGKVMPPGSYGSALLEFPRNCRAGGVPLRGLYRRRLAEACVFSDLPWENACSITVVKLAVDAAGNIDPFDTTSLEDTLQRARQDIPVFKPDTSDVITKSWGELVLTDKAPEQPAAPPVASPVEAKEAAPVPASQPEPGPASPTPNTGESKPASSAVPAGPTAPPRPQQAPPMSTAPPIATKPPPSPIVIAPKSIDINSIPYGEIDAANGAKNMSESKRVIGMVVVGIGSVIQVVTTRLGVGTAIGAVTFDLSRDPVVVALFVGAVVGVVAFFTRKRGAKIVTKGMIDAKQVLK